MPEKVQVNEQFIRRHPELFQKTILLAAIKSYQFYVHVKERLCPYEEERKARRPDFVNREYNRIYGMVADFWESISPQLEQGRDYRMSFNDVEEMLRSEMLGARIDQAEAVKLSEMLQDDMSLYEFTPDALTRLHQNATFGLWLNKRAASNLIEMAFNQRLIKPISLDDLATMVKAAQSSIGVDESRFVRADILWEQQIASLPFETDLQAVNDATSGGLRPMTTTLVAGINGGGKTILAMQWAKHFALLGANVVVFTTEQPPAQLITRMLSNHLRVGIDRFVQPPMEGISLRERRGSRHTVSIIPEPVLEECREPILRFYQDIWPRILFVDWSQSPLAVYKDFDAEMDRISSTGWDPDVVIFDWIGGGIDSVRGPGGGKSLDIRILYKEAIETIISHGKRYNRVMIAMAQLNKTNVGPSKKAVVMQDLAECKSMTDNVANFIGISALRTKMDLTAALTELKQTLALKQYLNLDKSRFGPGGLVPVEAHFRIQTFAPSGSRRRLD